ncbi:MAG: hypothetical protein EBT03_07455 [Betaproteobacteria bacterium]|nr:hypothetical protein [Betaproteobacteria bacterium]NCA17008.1 hypothetical protein [Betaproteobacteria bacterium]
MSRRVVEVASSPGTYVHGRGKRHAHHPAPLKPAIQEVPLEEALEEGEGPEEEEECESALPEPVPLEMLPALRAIKGYARRMNAIGSLRALHLLEEAVGNLLPYLKDSPEGLAVLLDIASRGEALRQESTNTARVD